MLRLSSGSFQNFSVEKCFDELLKAQDILNNNGSVQGLIHRYLIAAHK